MKSKKGFTLIELLAVMVVLGIIMTLAIPAVRNITYSSSVKEYNYHQQLVHEASKLYARSYKSDINKTSSECINIPYEELIKEGLIEEENIQCEGNIILEKRNEVGYNYKYYINCYDGETLVHASDLGGLPLACQGVNGNFKVNYSLYKNAENTIPYTEGEWAQYVYARYNSSSPYNYPIEKYQYTTDFINWKDTETANMQMYTNMNNDVLVRAIDGDGNVSELLKHSVMGDSEGPTFSLSYDEDQYLSGGEIPITINKDSIKDEGVGVDVLGAIYAFGDEAWSSTNVKNVAANTNLDFKVKDKLGNIGYVKTETIKVCSADALTEATTGTAVAGNILSGKTAWVNGVKVTGTMTNQGAKTATLSAGGSYTIPAGYHNGTGKITANSLASQTEGTATADDLASGKTAWVNGVKITGTGSSTQAIIDEVKSAAYIKTNYHEHVSSCYKTCTVTTTYEAPYSQYDAGSDKTYYYQSVKKSDTCGTTSSDKRSTTSYSTYSSWEIGTKTSTYQGIVCGKTTSTIDSQTIEWNEINIE